MFDEFLETELLLSEQLERWVKRITETRRDIEEEEKKTFSGLIRQVFERNFLFLSIYTLCKSRASEPCPFEMNIVIIVIKT
jgi:hypothetical protein